MCTSLVPSGWRRHAFDVTARAFTDTNPANNAGADEDLARLMLRSLLIEKFQIKWHMEDRPMPAFAIVADSPKMTKGDPTKRTRCYEGPSSRLACSCQAASVPPAVYLRERIDAAVRPAAPADRL